MSAAPGLVPLPATLDPSSSTISVETARASGDPHPHTDAIPPVAAPAPASAPTTARSRLTDLDQAIRAKMRDMDMWTKLREEYPDLAPVNERQMERTQREIFELREEIERERAKAQG